MAKRPAKRRRSRVLKEAETRLERHPRPANPRPKTVDVESLNAQELKAYEAGERKKARERDIRRFLRRKGGYRADMCDEDKAFVDGLMDRWNTDYTPSGSPKRTVKDGWDADIFIEGYDNCSHVLNQKKFDLK